MQKKSENKSTGKTRRKVRVISGPLPKDDPLFTGGWQLGGIVIARPTSKSEQVAAPPAKPEQRPEQNGGSERQYDVVMASNVLNVQPNWASLARTLAGIASATKPDGKAVMNYPRKPRRWIQASEDQIKTTIGFYFRNVQVAPVNSDGLIFEATCPEKQ